MVERWLETHGDAVDRSLGHTRARMVVRQWRGILDAVAAGRVAVPVDTTRFTEEEQDRFIDGWAEAGGPCDDGECSDPWCCPWYWKPEIIVHGTTPEEWGADFYRQCKPELDAILAEEEDEED